MPIRSPLMRLNKFLAHRNVGSRRHIDAMIINGDIKVNGQVVNQLGTKIDPHKDTVQVKEATIEPRAKVSFLYLMLHKPQGVISTANDSVGRRTVLDLVPSGNRLYPVGRLDQDSTGLILLTNDGELTYRLTHPRYHIPKTYEVEVLGKVSQTKIIQLSNGIELEDGFTRPAQVKVLESYPDKTLLEFILHEGRKRQIRRMCAALHLFVLSLKRIKLGPLTLGDLPEGKWRALTESEVLLCKKVIDHQRQ